MASMCFIPTGNYSRMVSYSTWHQCVSYRQETIRVWFPVRFGTAVFHIGRKLFVYGFLSGLALLRFIPTGNYSRMVSYPAWDGCVSYRQETVCAGFPIRLGTAVFHTDRKLFAYDFLSDLAPVCFIPTGNYSRMVSCPIWHCCVSYRQETSWRGDFSTPLRCARNDRAAVHYGVSCPQETVPLSHYFTVSLIPTQIIRPAGFCFSLLLW